MCLERPSGVVCYYNMDGVTPRWSHQVVSTCQTSGGDFLSYRHQTLSHALLSSLETKQSYHCNPPPSPRFLPEIFLTRECHFGHEVRGVRPRYVGVTMIQPLTWCPSGHDPWLSQCGSAGVWTDNRSGSIFTLLGRSDAIVIVNICVQS